MTHDATTVETSPDARLRGAVPKRHLALVLLWSRDEPQRIGEVLLMPVRRRAQPIVLGRGSSAASWVRQRPGLTEDTGPLTSPKLSRAQLHLFKGAEGAIEVQRVGKGALIDPRGGECDRCVVTPGQMLGIAGRALFLVSERPAHLPQSDHYPKELWPCFGQADSHGLVGESVVIWALREAIGRRAGDGAHTLILGPSGSGKELAADAIHALSSRRARPKVSRNAAAIPQGLIAAELFGSRRGYPHATSPERAGLVGAADGGTLVLDEVGELSHEAQAALLRVLDSDGEYQRLGESVSRQSDLRVLGLTNRSRSELKSDFAARFEAQLVLPSLSRRREDIPLLCAHLLNAAGETRPPSEEMIRMLIDAPLSLGVRELRALLSRASDTSPGETLSLSAPELDDAAPRAPGGEIEPDAETIRLTLMAHFGNREASAAALGLKNRFALYRLMKKYGVEL